MGKYVPVRHVLLHVTPRIVYRGFYVLREMNSWAIYALIFRIVSNCYLGASRINMQTVLTGADHRYAIKVEIDMMTNYSTNIFKIDIKENYHLKLRIAALPAKNI